jgi:hypothetical protein
LSARPFQVANPESGARLRTVRPVGREHGVGAADGRRRVAPQDLWRDTVPVAERGQERPHRRLEAALDDRGGRRRPAFEAVPVGDRHRSTGHRLPADRVEAEHRDVAVEYGGREHGRHQPGHDAQRVHRGDHAARHRAGPLEDRGGDLDPLGKRHRVEGQLGEGPPGRRRIPALDGEVRTQRHP